MMSWAKAENGDRTNQEMHGIERLGGLFDCWIVLGRSQEAPLGFMPSEAWTVPNLDSI
jgi:hypothetical protein